MNKQHNASLAFEQNFEVANRAIYEPVIYSREEVTAVKGRMIFRRHFNVLTFTRIDPIGGAARFVGAGACYCGANLDTTDDSTKSHKPADKYPGVGRVQCFDQDVFHLTSPRSPDPIGGGLYVVLL